MLDANGLGEFCLCHNVILSSLGRRCGVPWPLNANWRVTTGIEPLAMVSVRGNAWVCRFVLVCHVGIVCLLLIGRGVDQMNADN